MGLLRPRPVATIARTAVIAGTASAVSGRVHHRQQQRWSNQEAQAYEQAYEPAPPPPAPAPAAPVDPSMAQLEQLAALHAQGILTDEEFAAKKAQILGI
jgi:hypothetical protein